MQATRTPGFTTQDTAPVLVRRLERLDPATALHGRRVARHAVGLGRRVGIGGGTLRALALGATLHDVGKIGLPQPVLDKNGPLTEPEWTQVRCHPELGDALVAEWDVPAATRAVVLSHHERYDGAGYPFGLAGEEIPLAARVVAVADAIDAMTGERPYGTRRSVADAVDEVVRNAGTHFCPTVVRALVEPEGPEHEMRYFRRNALMRSAYEPSSRA